MTRIGLIGSLALVATLVQAAPPPAAPADPSDPRVELATHLPGAKPDDLRPSPVKGMYEYTRGTDIAYVTADGHYAINGDLYDIASDSNLTENHRRELRSKLIAAFPEDEMLVFKVYDSSRGGEARFTPHTAFEDPFAPLDRLPRQSIEVRVAAFY